MGLVQESVFEFPIVSANLYSVSAPRSHIYVSRRYVNCLALWTSKTEIFLLDFQSGGKK